MILNPRESQGALPGSLGGDRVRAWHFAALGAVCALVIGIYARSANSGFLELLASGPENTDYNLLARGFQSGQLNLELDAPAGLAQLADPYDPVSNESYRWRDGAPLHDMSYYKGKLYLYFGPTPALLLFWPFLSLTSHGLLHKEAVIVFLSAGFLASTALLWASWRRYFPQMGFARVAAGTLALGLANFTPLILQRCDVYEVAISCGYAMTMLALAALWGALHDSKRQGLWLGAASLAYGLALGARPSLLPGAVILLLPLAIRKRVETGRRGSTALPQSGPVGLSMPKLVLAAVGPIGLIGLALLFYNYIRFGNPLEFGQHFQLAGVRQASVQQFGARYGWFNFRAGFLEPARWSARFPFVKDPLLPFRPAGVSIEHPFGLLSNVPLAWLALAIPLAWRGRPPEARRGLRGFSAMAAILFVSCALIICFHNSLCIRYELEFAAPLLLLAIFGAWGLERALAGQGIWLWTARLGAGLLLFLSLAFNLLAGAACHAEACDNLARTLIQRGRTAQGVAAYQKALDIAPDDASAHFGLGNVLLDQGRLDEAIAHFQEAVNSNPDYGTAHNNLGNALFRKGRLDEAIAHYQTSLEIQPRNAEAQNNLGFALLQKGQLDNAILHYRKALDIMPRFSQARYNLGRALLQKKQVAEALSQFQLVLEAQPNDAEIHNVIALVLSSSPDSDIRDGPRALQLAQQANQLAGGRNPFVLRTVAAAYAESGKFPEAVAMAQEAMRLAEAQANASLTDLLRSQISLYQAGRPFRDLSLASSRTNGLN